MLHYTPGCTALDCPGAQGVSGPQQVSTSSHASMTRPLLHTGALFSELIAQWSSTALSQMPQDRYVSNMKILVRMIDEIATAAICHPPRLRVFTTVRCEASARRTFGLQRSPNFPLQSRDRCTLRVPRPVACVHVRQMLRRQAHAGTTTPSVGRIGMRIFGPFSARNFVEVVRRCSIGSSVTVVRCLHRQWT